MQSLSWPPPAKASKETFRDCWSQVYHHRPDALYDNYSIKIVIMIQQDKRTSKKKLKLKKTPVMATELEMKNVKLKTVAQCCLSNKRPK